MSHLIEEYEKSLGVKKSYPVVSKHFFPTNSDDYIVICNQQNIPSKIYAHFLMAVDLIKSLCRERGIKIYQIGSDPKEFVNGVDRMFTNLTFKQEAYIISKAKVFVGVDSVLSQYASSQKVPLVNLYGNVYSSITTGAWSKNKIDIEPEWKVKPSYNAQDPNLSINTIMPEQVAEAIFKFIDPKIKLNFRTKRIGKSFYDQNVIDVIPTSYADLQIFDGKTLLLRLDIDIDESSFYNYCQRHKCALIVKNNVIPLAKLQPVANNIQKIIFRLTDLKETIDPKYFEALKKLNIEHQIIIEDESIISDARLEYFDQNVVLYTPHKSMPDGISQDDCFFTFKKVVEGANVYESKAHWRNKQLSVDKQTKILDTPEYWEDLEYYYIYEQNKDS
tara:strand:+ start:7798 stop:8964 length:1167 start_codon:yes stop_codon:yes gene_type:complete